MERIRRILTDCLSLPKIMGIGPTMTTAPPLVFPPADLAREITATNTARMTPATMRIVPRVTILESEKFDSSRLLAR